MQRWQQYRVRRGVEITAFCITFLIGIGIAHSGQKLSAIALCSSIVVCLLLIRRHHAWFLLALSCLGLSLGWQRGELFMAKLAAFQVLDGSSVMLDVTAQNDAVYGSNSQLSFDVGDIHLADGQQLHGKMQVSGFGPKAVFQGDQLQVSGKLYPGYGQYQGRISFAKLVVVGHGSSPVASLRRKFTAGVQSALPEPEAPFAMGLLIGQRATLPTTTKQDLLMIGLTHIIAVSGYNLTIILNASKRLLAKRSKRMATALSLALIGVFLLLAGTSASIVRAAIVSVLSIIIGYYGRSLKPSVIILLAAVITAWASPYYVWSDISWYLSFLAFYGVLVLSPLIQDRLGKWWRDSLVTGVALESVCAEMMTLPFILFNFGQMSFAGLPANLLIASLVPAAMLLSTIAGIAAMVCSSLSGWIAWPASILLTYMLDGAHVMASLPHVFVQHIAFSLPLMLVSYAIVLTLIGNLWLKSRAKTAILTDEFGLGSNIARSGKRREPANVRT